jgi:hypothetical protein
MKTACIYQAENTWILFYYYFHFSQTQHASFQPTEEKGEGIP